MSMTAVLVFIVAGLIILGLGIYAGRLLFLVNTQNQKQNAVRDKRIGNITQSIQTIAFAMMQQQCDLSEGVIRICNLLEALPVDPVPNYADHYPSIYKLFELVKEYPTHDARAAQSKATRRKQDKEREQYESELENDILKEAEVLRSFQVKL